MVKLQTQNFRKLLLLIMIAPILVLTACSSNKIHQAYKGQAKPDSETATFRLPPQFNLLAINGIKYVGPAFTDGAVVKILPGSHQFLIEYQDFIELGGETYEKVESRPVSIDFAAMAGAQYTINADRIADIEIARNYAENPDIKIINTTNGQNIQAKIRTNIYTLKNISLMDSESETISGTKHSVSTPPVAAVITTPTMAPSSTTSQSTSDSSSNEQQSGGQALDMLKYWWKAADQNQHNQFRQWIESQ